MQRHISHIAKQYISDFLRRVLHVKFLLSVVLLLSLMIPVFSFEPSGGVLMLDGEDDYAILPLVEHGYIFPKHTDEFTVEMWFYPKTGPKHKEQEVILRQQVSFGLTSSGDCELDKDQLCCWCLVHLEGAVHGIIGTYVKVQKNQWNYVAIIYKDSTFHLAYNNWILRSKKFDLMNQVAAEIRKKRKDFFVGGYEEDIEVFKGNRLQYISTRFHGEIDAIKFSNIARYALPAERGIEPFDPPHRLSDDAHTLALWNFDERAGATRFVDASGNGKMLIGMNGAITSGPLAVNPRSTSITTTWGQIKSKSF